MAFRQIMFRGLPRRNHINLQQNILNRTRLSYVSIGFCRNLRCNKKINYKTNRRFNSTLTPFDNLQQHGFNSPSSSIIRSFVFTVGFSAGSFIGVTIWEYEQIRNKAIKAFKNGMRFTWLKQKILDPAITGKTDEFQNDFNRIKQDIKNWWQSLAPGERIFAPILALNLIVFGLWRIPRFQPLMLKYFCSNPAGKAICWPMVLSTFSHYSLFHLAANMYVLHSFAHGSVHSLGQEQFLGMYLSAGVFSSFASYLYKALTNKPGMSLGASGAIMAVLAYVCVQYPETKLSILFLPQVQFAASSAIQVIMGIDLAGILLGWKFFDHAAHLGGAAFGIFWCYVGQKHLWPLREHFIGYWHQLRGKAKP